MKNSDYIEQYEHLQDLVDKVKEENPVAMKGFDQLHLGAVSPEALDRKTAELMALAISIVVRCDGCIAYHVRDSLTAGATRQEISETIAVAVLMGGGPALVYGAQALEAMEQFETK